MHFCLLEEIRTEEIPDLLSERGRRRGRTFCWRELRILVPGVPPVQNGEAQVSLDKADQGTAGSVRLLAVAGL